MTDKIRCAWVPLDKPLYIKYHDEEWGVPVHDDRHLFEAIVLDGAQAGLSWWAVLNKRVVCGVKSCISTLLECKT